MADLSKISEHEKEIIKQMLVLLPDMSEREKGYLEGTIATAAAMSDLNSKKREKDDEV